MSLSENVSFTPARNTHDLSFILDPLFNSSLVVALQARLIEGNGFLVCAHTLGNLLARISGSMYLFTIRMFDKVAVHQPGQASCEPGTGACMFGLLTRSRDFGLRDF